MINNSNFFSSMSSVLNQWSDFSVSKNLYKAYFNMQKAENTSSEKDNSNYLQKLIDKSTEKLYKNSDKLGALSTDVSEAVSKLDNAFAVQANGEMDYDAAYSAAEGFVKSYNDLVTSVRGSGDMTISNKSEFINNISNAYTRRFEKVGISINADGTLALDKEGFNGATSSQLDDVFGKKNSFASFMSDQSKQLAAYAEAQKKNTVNAYNQSGSVTNIANISGSFFSMLG